MNEILVAEGVILGETVSEMLWMEQMLTNFASRQNEENEEIDLAELDIEEGVGLEEYKDVGKREEEEDDVEEAGNEEEELVSSQDMEYSVIVVAPRR
ncbi:hypothetical protein BDD12DRAFT_881572 [Trichophaea hybrida]|nr:hypothetical protein BDD12DRAFT_881572 [Trichophaea hybrida]